MSDLDRLDAFLSSDESPDDCLLLSDLDGFLHGIACSPIQIPSEEWMSTALGSSPEDVPSWVFEAIASRYMEICQGLMMQRPVVEPVFWEAREGHVIAMDWCEGFMWAVELRMDHWEPFIKSEDGSKVMMPILVHMFDDKGNSVFGLPQEEVDDALDWAAEAIPLVVPLIFRQLAPSNSTGAVEDE